MLKKGENMPNENNIPFIDLKTQYNQIKEGVATRLNNILENTAFILGNEVSELEEKLAKYTGSKKAIAVSSGTDALMVALMALDIKVGDEVITTPYTFIATAEVIALLGAKPVFVDIDSKTYNIDPQKIEDKITSKTKAIMTVSLYGQVADMDEINTIAKKHNLPVIEDACQSFGATYKGQQSCNLSTIGCTSFFPSKPLGCYGDGGAVFTNDEELAQKMNYIHNHGQDKRYNHPMLGINGRLDAMQAAILNEKLDKIFVQEVKDRSQIGQRYSEALKDVVVVPFIEKYNTSVYAQYTIQIENRDKFLENMQKHNVPTAVHYPIPLHLQPVFSNLGLSKGSLPVSEKLSEKVCSLPMHPYLSEEDQDRIINAVKESVE